MNPQGDAAAMHALHKDPSVHKAGYTFNLDAAAQTSTDPDTQVGCVITDIDNNVLIVAANTHTMGTAPTDANSARPVKYDFIEHAERNAIYEAARRGVPLGGATLHLTGFPCVECSRAMAQAGIRKLVHGSTDGFDPVRYKFAESRQILANAMISLEERKA